MPLRYAGTTSPTAVDTRRAPEVTAVVVGVVLFTVLAVGWFFIRESRLGRFTPVEAPVDADWMRTHILTLPPEVVGAAWDSDVEAPEVVAVIARMVGEGKLSSATAADRSLTLTLNVGRSSLQGYELALVDGLFFDGRTVTTTAELKDHYKRTGFNPAQLIAPDLAARVKEVLPGGESRMWWQASLLAALLIIGLVVYDSWSDSSRGSVISALLGIFAGVLGTGPAQKFY